MVKMTQQVEQNNRHRANSCLNDWLNVAQCQAANILGPEHINEGAAHESNRLQKDIPLNQDTLFWLWANQPLLLIICAVCWAKKQQIPIIMSWVWSSQVLNQWPSSFLLLPMVSFPLDLAAYWSLCGFEYLETQWLDLRLLLFCFLCYWWEVIPLNVHIAYTKSPFFLNIGKLVLWSMITHNKCTEL